VNRTNAFPEYQVVNASLEGVTKTLQATVVVHTSDRKPSIARLADFLVCFGQTFMPRLDKIYLLINVCGLA
jgi:hypothetical protein